MDPQRDPEMVPLLLDFKARLEVLHVEAFVPNEGFTQTVKSAFEHVVNARQNRPAEVWQQGERPRARGDTCNTRAVGARMTGMVPGKPAHA